MAADHERPDIQSAAPSYEEQQSYLRDIQDYNAITLHTHGITRKAQAELGDYLLKYVADSTSVRPLVRVQRMVDDTGHELPAEELGVQFEIIKRDLYQTGELIINPFVPIAERIGRTVFPREGAEDTYSLEDADIIGGLAESLQLEQMVGALPDLDPNLTRIQPQYGRK